MSFLFALSRWFRKREFLAHSNKRLSIRVIEIFLGIFQKAWQPASRRRRGRRYLGAGVV